MTRKNEIDKLLGDRAGLVQVELAAGGGSIPVIAVRGRSLAEVWEVSLLALYGHGIEIWTEYDRRDDGGRYLDPPSLDCTMRMIVADPLAEPMVHRCLPGGLEDLEEYRQEVLDGIKDHWIRDPNDPQDQRWEYTYHERIFNYRVPGVGHAFNQIEMVADGLAKSPHSRRRQAVVWKVWEDSEVHDPACLQSLWFRVLPDEEGVWRLNLNVRFRSRDAYDAAFMNCFALIHLQKQVARMIAERAGREVKLGRYVDESDSYHIYGHRLEDFKARLLRLVSSRPFEQRAWTLEFCEPMFEEARPRIVEKIRKHDQGGEREK